ncbi:39S ribosomal protein L33, mitochondrial isoform X1 [Cyanistes caeruleus]|nr:39S ribosomal protein L33, mitochondrial isoform X1 [Cyanistes caeruleus]
MESELNAHMQRCIHVFIEMEEKDVIYRLVKGLFFFLLILKKMPSGKLLGFWRFPDWGCRAASLVSCFMDIAIAANLPCKLRALQYILVRMKSAAETGYCFNIRRLRLQEKLVLLRYDPIAKQRVLFTEKRKIRSV